MKFTELATQEEGQTLTSSKKTGTNTKWTRKSKTLKAVMLQRKRTKLGTWSAQRDRDGRNSNFDEFNWMEAVRKGLWIVEDWRKREREREAPSVLVLWFFDFQIFRFWEFVLWLVKNWLSVAEVYDCNCGATLALCDWLKFQVIRPRFVLL